MTRESFDDWPQSMRSEGLSFRATGGRGCSEDDNDGEDKGITRDLFLSPSLGSKSQGILVMTGLGLVRGRRCRPPGSCCILRLVLKPLVAEAGSPVLIKRKRFRRIKFNIKLHPPRLWTSNQSVPVLSSTRHSWITNSTSSPPAELALQSRHPVSLTHLTTIELLLKNVKTRRKKDSTVTISSDNGS